MSTDSLSTPPLPPAEPPPKKQSLAVRLILAICGVIVMVGGVIKVVSGIHEMLGSGTDKQTDQLTADSDKAIDEANRNVTEAQPVYQGFLNDVDKVGLTEVRAKEKEIEKKASDLFAKSSDAFHAAEKKLEEASQRNINEKLKLFFAAKIKSYGYYAESADVNREIVRLVLEDPIADIDALMPKITEAANRRDEALKNAAKASADADEIVKKK